MHESSRFSTSWPILNFWLFYLFVCLFIGSSHSDGFEVLSQCGSDLHFLNISATVNISDVGHHFCVFIGLLCVFGEMPAWAFACF